LCRADHSSRGVLPTVVRLSVIVMPRKRGGPGPLGEVVPWGKEVHFVALKMKNCSNAHTASPCPYVCPYACNNSRTAEQISVTILCS
jgi:hypothetical protein